ncbi:MAG: HRDC domain-containing protein [Geodermatophilaceae bacterium]
MSSLDSSDAEHADASPTRRRRTRSRTAHSPAVIPRGDLVRLVEPSGPPEAGEPVAPVDGLDPVELGDDPPEPESTAIALIEPRDGVPEPLTTAQQVSDYAARLAAGSGPVAVDAERASGYRYGQRAYLVQIRRRGVGTALIDPIAVPDLSPIQQAIGDSEWVLHAASQDLLCLGEVGLAPALLFDTELGARLAGFARVGLGALVEELLGLRLEKGHSAADWSTRPLPRDWLIYAALDVEVLIELRDTVRERLVETGKLAWAEEEFAALLAAPAPTLRVDPWRRTSGTHSLRSRRQLAALRSLWTTRDDVARGRDIAPGRILHDKAMIAGVLADPASADAMVGLPVFRGRANRKLITTWYGALQQARALPESDLPPLTLPNSGPPPPNRWAEREPAAAARLVAVRKVIAELIAAHDVPAENLLNPDLLRRLTWHPPTPLTDETVAERLRDGGAREWQIGLTAGPLATAMTAAANSAAVDPDPESAE